MTPQSQKSSYTLEEVMQMYGGRQPVQPSIQAAQQTNPYGATFLATGEEGAIGAGLKAAGNVPSSALNFAKNIYSAVTSPVQTAKAIGGAVTDIGRTFMNVTGMGPKQTTPTLSALGEAIGERYGSLEKAKKTAIEDPFGVGSDILGVLTGGAGALGKGAALSRGISTVGGAVTSPIARGASGFSNKVSNTVRFGVSQATGLSPETVSTIARNRRAFSEAQAIGTTRTDLAENVLGAVKKAQDDLSDLGSAYDTIRSTQASVSLPENWVQSSLNKYGLKFQDNKVGADRTSATRNTTDINKIQEFVDNWGDARTLTPEEYLNMRHDLAELAKYDMSGKSTVVRQFAQDVREGMLNSEKVRGQIPGLKDLDTKYAADKTFLNTIEKDFINPKTGNLKDGAASKVVNAINAANPERLARLEQLYPGFTQQAKVVKAIEDVENSMGIKTGTYVRAGVGISAAVSGNLPLVVAAILSTPEIAVPLIKGYGWTADQVAPVLKAARDIASDINNFRTPGAIERYFEENYKDGVPVGMSIKKSVTPESVAKKIDLEDFNRIVDVLDDPGLAKTDPDTVRMLNDMGLGRATDDELIRFLREVTDEAEKYKAIPKVQSATTKTTDLLEEAKKYKSAEEFVKTMSDNRVMNPKFNAIVESSEFKAWFGKSKLVDPAGNVVKAETPTVFYHRSSADFDNFLSRAELQAKGAKLPDYRDTDSGFYFSRKDAGDYYGNKKYAVALKAEKIKQVTSDISSISDSQIQKLKAQGYDAIESPDEIVVFGKDQIWPLTRNGQPIGKTKSLLTDIWKKANK